MSMSFVFEGILGGLSLAILLGPIFIILIQTGMERGVTAGVSVGSGIWTSDLLIILGFYIFLRELKEIVDNPDFIFWFGAIGGLIVFSFGLYLCFRKTTLDLNQKRIKAKEFLGYWTKGFLVNTINPFTFIFWMGFITSFVISRQLDNTDSFILLSSIFFTIVITDILKVVSAKMIRSRLTLKTLSRINILSGVVVAIFGLIIFYRCVFPEEAALLLSN